MILRDYVSSTDYMFSKSRNSHSSSRESESRRVGGNGYREGTTTNSHNESHNNHGHLRDIAEGRAKQTRSLADKYLLAIWEERKLLLTSKGIRVRSNGLSDCDSGNDNSLSLSA